MKTQTLLVIGAVAVWLAMLAPLAADEPIAPAATPPSQAIPGKPVLLFILAGQSNAGGKGVGSELPPELRTADPDALMIGRRARTLTPIAPYRREGFGADNTAFGCEISFARQVRRAYPDHAVVIAKQTSGGTSIIAWDKHHERPDWKADLALVKNEQKEPLYPKLLAVVQEAKEAIKAAGRFGQIELAGMIWVQSERDDDHPKTAAMYERNLRSLIANVRADLGAAELPFVFADVNGHRNADVIHAGMRRVADHVPHVAMAAIKDLPKVDAAHYDTQGQLELGRRFAAAWRTMRDAAQDDKPPEHGS